MQTSLGPDANLLAAVGYVFWILAVLFFFVEDESDFVRFHAVQSILLGVILSVVLFAAQIFLGILGLVLGFVSDILGTLVNLLMPLVALGCFAVVVFMTYKAFQGEMYKLPLIGGIAEGQV